MLIEKYIESELEKIQQENLALLEKLVSFPPGELRIQKNRKWFRWYKVTDAGHIYLPKKHRPEAITLAHKQYVIEQLKTSESKIDALKQCLDALKKAEKSAKIRNNSGYQELLKDVFENEITAEQEWINAPFKKSEERKEYLIHQSLRGEKMRSKSEALIADSLYRFGIPYRYEQELVLGESIIYPDFVIWSHGKEVIWEHLGMLSKENYIRRNLYKIGDYLSYGYLPGNNLLLTSETQENPLSSVTVERIIECFLL